jgi:adsorption protein B
MFLQQNVITKSMEIAHGTKTKKQEPLATREYFPSNFRQAVRQKSRWILGIALQGWSIGWARTCGQNYFLFRDRKSIVTNISVMFGYLLILYSICMALVRSYTSITVPPLARPGDLTYFCLLTVMGMFVWRMMSRILSSWHIYGPKHGLLAMPRLIIGNVLNFCATYCAIKQFIAAKFSNKNPEWIKTDHAFPSEDQLLHYRRRLGDLLLEKRLVSTSQLEEALEKQKQSGKPLGEVLLEMNVLWEEDLMGVLASQQNKVFIEIDPYATSPEALALVPQPVALKYHIFPLAIEDGVLILASDNVDSKEHCSTIEDLFDCPVSLRWSAEADIMFAIKRAYAEMQSYSNSPKSRLGEHLVESGAISAEALTEALRKQKRSDDKLGEILINMGVISPEKLKQELDLLN